MKAYSKAIKFSADFELATPLLIKSGLQGEFTDSSIEKTPAGNCLHINGYVWSSLLRRALSRLRAWEHFARQTGKYDPSQTHDLGVSPLWCESSLVELKETDVRPGNRIDRRYGAAASGALYSDELVPPGYKIKLDFNYFLKASEESNPAKQAFMSALYVINEGIENIGGGWSYGLGRLRLADGNPVKFKELDLSKTEGRKPLWEFDGIEWDSRMSRDEINLEGDVMSKGWRKISVHGKIAGGQLLAVHSNYPVLDEHEQYPEMPDHYVYKRYHIENNKPAAQYAIPGKTIRQALLSTQIERKLRTAAKEGAAPCLDSTKGTCACGRCKWFGNKDQSGIIAVSDAVVEKAELVILHRVQLCEHSMQNINLFTGEYLKNGEFGFDIWIDYSREDSDSSGLENEIFWLLGEMRNQGTAAPEGWYRIGATSTCTGQVEIIGIDPGVTCRPK